VQASPPVYRFKMSEDVLYIAVSELPQSFNRVADWVQRVSEAQMRSTGVRAVVDFSRLPPGQLPSISYLQELAEVLRPLLAGTASARCALVVPDQPLLWRARLFESITSGSRICFRAFERLDEAREWLDAERTDIEAFTRQQEPLIDETILVVEDDDDVRAMISEVLRVEGWRVLTAKDGQDAINAASEHAAPIDAVVVDVQMPRMNGLSLLELLRGWYPSMRFLFISGHQPPPKLMMRLVDPNTRFLAKPFGAEELVRSVLALLDQTPRAS
jgi:CheY-like chemotaxis protein